MGRVSTCETVQVVTMYTSSLFMMVLMAAMVQTSPLTHAEALAQHAAAEARVRAAARNDLVRTEATTGCTVGPSGEKVCLQGAFGADGVSKVTARGNKGHSGTGSNGNAAPLNAQGLAYDPAAETYKKQIIAYQKWAEQQVENGKRQLGTAGR